MIACPAQMRFTNQVLDKGGIRDLIADVFDICGLDQTTIVADEIKEVGFRFATQSGSTMAVSDISVPPEKVEFVNEPFWMSRTFNSNSVAVC